MWFLKKEGVADNHAVLKYTKVMENNNKLLCVKIAK